MRYADVVTAVFIRRVNRFIADVILEGGAAEREVHVKNTGRCTELLLPGAAVVLEVSDKPGRRTAYSLIAVYKGATLINIDSQAPNAVAYEALLQGRIAEVGRPLEVRREVRFGGSRFDFSLTTESGPAFLEVKGVTLERGGEALFPDAPTQRGTRHLVEMAEAVGEGYGGYVLFLIQMQGVRRFGPNREMDPRFTDALGRAAEAGVKMMAYDAVVRPDGLFIGNRVRMEI